MSRWISSGFLAKTWALYEKMFGVLVTGIFSAVVAGTSRRT
jgi:hypothetical protein